MQMQSHLSKPPKQGCAWVGHFHAESQSAPSVRGGWKSWKIAAVIPFFFFKGGDHSLISNQRLPTVSEVR